MAKFTSPNPRMMAPLPRRDILAICAFLNRNFSEVGGAKIGAEIELDRLAAAARMQ